MQNEQNNSRTSILNELPLGNSELGEAFALILDNMIMQSGIYNPKSEDFDIVSPKWRELASKENKTEDDILVLDTTFKECIKELAQSYILFIARNTGNNTGKLTYEDYEKYLLKYRFGRYDKENKPEYINKVKAWIKNAFDKISSHGESSGDDLIDKDDMSAYLYALATKTRKNSDGSFGGFEINGIIKPQEYAVAEHFLFADDKDNIITIKLRVAYKVLNDKL